MNTAAAVCLYLSVLAGPALDAITAAQAEWNDGALPR
jgi:hypothetical protein